MRFISLFLLFTLFIYATCIEELHLPKCLKYESMKKVIDNDWSYADKHIKKFMENNSTTYVDTFMRLVDKPLVLKTDEEYIEEQIMHHKEFINDKNLTALFPNPVENIIQYSKRVKKEVRYKIYSFDRYKYTISPEIYRGVYLYIRYLEYTQQFDKTFDIYNKIARRLGDAYLLENKIFINSMMQNLKVEEYIQALTISLKNSQYSKIQKQILYNILSQFLLDKSLFSKMLISEKQWLFKYLNMFYFDENASAKTMMNHEIFFRGMLKLIGKENLEKHLNNKQTMVEVVKNYKFDIEQIHHELLSFKTMKEYKDYVDKKGSLTAVFDYLDLPRLFVLYMTDDLEYKSVSNAFKYDFSSSEFIKFVRKFYIFYGKPWVWGKYKFKYEERLEKNKKFLELLKN